MGDVSVNKRMKDLTKIFYDILIKLNSSKDNNFTVNEKLTFKYIQIISNKNNIKLISASWSTNKKKGMDDYKWLDENLNLDII